MKTLCTLLLSLLVGSSFGQDKNTQFNTLLEIEGTAYVMASTQKSTKTSDSPNEKLLFLNTQTGNSHKVSFGDESRIVEIKQVKMDDLEINTIIVEAKTTDMNGKGGIGWGDPEQIFALSTDGKNKTQLTNNDFFPTTWTTNRQTGTIIIAGHIDSNKNGKFDNADQHKILVFDLKTLKLQSEI